MVLVLWRIWRRLGSSSELRRKATRKGTEEVRETGVYVYERERETDRRGLGGVTRECREARGKGNIRSAADGPRRAVGCSKWPSIGDIYPMQTQATRGNILPHSKVHKQN